ncbi:DUF7507 domain-containing protein [Aquiflexum gelatinilyticum]|uniref:Gliding motility-associated C-terminal domain-containing protein n=1 Tax=Aquiflexum gelatinilyticum TaxID=2961943 RepID=A0A9X2P9I2_9BACT|nr:gliding motility-associated C-terminal domain-containing protein [Aquiflexum gelatinilyticum]MCR9016290.1 gliding motility-associated C-terminal domain-containing protein [Aquiflexum gelatinilyticum]
MKAFFQYSFKKALLTNLFLILLTGVFSGKISAQTDNRVPFKHRVGNPAPENNIFKLRGDFTIIGNTNLTLLDQNEVNNSNNQMIYVDVDNNQNTVNSSSSTLVFSRENNADPNCSEIIYAGLYWSGRANPDLGMNFDVAIGTENGAPVTVSNKVQIAMHTNPIAFSFYTLTVGRNGSETNRYPRFSFTSKKGGDTYQFEFSNNNNNPARYRIGTSGPMTTLSNQTVSTDGNIRTVTFDPITITDGEVTLKIDRLQRIISRTEEVAAYQTEENFARITADGVFIPEIVKTVNLDKRKIRIKGPSSSDYQEITAAENDILYPAGELDDMYVGYADITQYIKNQGIGEYTVANVALTEGNGGRVGYFGHWGIVVVYENSKMNWRDVTVFDGYSYLKAIGDPAHVDGTLAIEGFKAVPNGPVNLKLGVMVGEGERGFTGDYLEIRNAADTEWVRLNHALNETNNFFNSSIYTPVSDNNGNLIANPRNPQFDNNTGIDIAMWNVPNPDNSIIANGQTSTVFRYGSRNDSYNIYSIAFSVDAYVPDIQGLNQIATINGEPATENPTVQPGQEIEYTLDIRNLGTEEIENGKVIIPIPFTSTFVDADFEVFFTSNTVKAPYFDPNLGATGSIVWELGELPLLEDINSILARITFKLKATEDCLILSNPNCDAFISVGGSISGKGKISQSEFSGIQLTQGFLDGDCEGEPIQTPLIIPIVGATEWANSNCGEVDLFDSFSFCNINPEEGIPFNSIAISFPVGIRFFDGIDPNKSNEFTASNPFPATSGTYFGIPVNSSNCIFEFKIEVSIVTTSPTVAEGAVYNYCQGQEIPNLNTLINPSNLGGESEYDVFFFTQAEGGEALQGYQIDSNDTGTVQIWVAEGSSSDCTGPRVLVTVNVNTCSIIFEKSGKLVDEDGNNITNAGDKIVYTFTVTNTGNVDYTNITLVDPKVTVVGGPIEILAPGATDSTTFTAEYILTQEDIDFGSFTNVATVKGDFAENEIEVSDDDVQVFEKIESIAVSKSTETETFNEVGQIISYTITVTNTGNTTLTNISVVDPLTGMDEIIPSLSPGQTVSFQTTYTVKVEDLISGTILNTVLVSTTGSDGDEVDSTDSVTIVGSKNEIIANDDEFGTHALDFGGVLGNILSNDLLNGQPVTPDNVNFEFVELDGIIGLLTTGDGELSLIPGVNEAREYRLKYILTESLNPTNSDEAFVTFRLVNSEVDMSITKTSNNAEIFEGDEFEYQIDVTNSSSFDATNVVVVDDLPNGITYVSSRFISTSTDINVSTDLTGTKLTYTIPYFPANSKLTIHVKVKANALINGSPLSIVNRVTVVSDEDDTNPDNNAAEDSNEINLFFIPNVITPNNDGKNDRFVIKGSQKFAKREIVILNRFGDHLYENSNYDNDWSAEGIVGGTYFFVFRGTDSEGKVHEFKGWIQVIKK